MTAALTLFDHTGQHDTRNTVVLVTLAVVCMLLGFALRRGL